MKRAYSFSLLFIAGTMMLSACNPPSAAQDREVIRIGHLPITHAAPLYFTKEYEDELLPGYELELVRFSSWVELMDALNTGRIDGASVLFELGMKAKERGIDISAVALGHREGNAIITGHDIDSVEELEGKTVAVPHTLSAHNLLLDEMLRRAGMDYDSVNMVEMPPPEMPAALAEDRISSYIVAEPFGALGVTLDTGKVLYQSNEFCPNNCLCCALVLRDDFMEASPELADQFIKGYLEAGQIADVGDADALAVHQNYLSVNEEVLDLSLGWISYGDLAIREDEYTFLQERLVEMGLSDNPPDYDDFILTDYFVKEDER